MIGYWKAKAFSGLVLGTTIAIVSLCSSAEASDPSKAMVFGGRDHKLYLGCISCNKYQSDSIWNEYSPYGSKYESNSMWNKYGDYGNKYSPYSPCNEYASDSPVVVDDVGRLWGRLSVSTVYANGTLLKAAKTICKE
jgi:hypothetical protein